MMGDLQSAIVRNLTELQELGLGTTVTSTAIDLGAGPGGYAIPLANLGYSVLAMDTCSLLVEELQTRKETLPIRVVQDDLLSFRQYAEQAEVILCMGDTLTHLPSRDAVNQLLDGAIMALTPTGLFCATFRDYYTRELRDAARFISVRSDEQRILTCFLEYGAEQVTVYDILQERAEPNWRLSVSSYPKLRLDPVWVVENLEALGTSVQQDVTTNGMVRISARKY
jgi:2-polyprenyl-3-methyl-5-hydroxy-6-metoxy-1,4-benzoquinol methylase